MGVVENKRSLRGTQGAAKCFPDFSSAHFQSVYITIYRHKRPFYIAFIKYFETKKCASAHRKSLSSDTWMIKIA
jgi:hypothetical protein